MRRVSLLSPLHGFGIQRDASFATCWMSDRSQPKKLHLAPSGPMPPGFFSRYRLSPLMFLNTGASTG